MLVNAAVACTDDLNSIINLETTLQPLVDSKAMAKEIKDSTMKAKMDELDARFLKVRFHPYIHIPSTVHRLISWICRNTMPSLKRSL
jgi:hypothetical protein